MLGWGVYVTKGVSYSGPLAIAHQKAHQGVLDFSVSFIRSCTSKYCEIPNDEIFMKNAKNFFLNSIL